MKEDFKKIFKNKVILVTGGTGTFGNAFIDYVIKKKINLKKLIIFSRDEFKQHYLQLKYPEKKFKFLRFFLGDIRDQERLNMVFQNVDFVINAAALKHVYKAEYDPIEFIKTNVIGIQNIISCSLRNKVEKVITLSTDKACEPSNLYGASKLCAEKVLQAANNIKGNKKVSFVVVRYGNVLNSRGSIVPRLKDLKNKNQINITDRKMTRFSMLAYDAVELVLWSFANTYGTEIVIPKLKSYKLIDLVKAIYPKAQVKCEGKKIGEKIHEKLISDLEAENTYDVGKYFLIINNEKIKKEYLSNKIKLKKVKFINYNSKNNIYLSINELKLNLKSL